MKRLGLLSIALLAGCVPTQKEYTIIRETSRPVVQTENVATPATPVEAKTETPSTSIATTTQNMAQPCAHMTTDGKPACMQPAPTYFAGTYNQPQGVYQTQQQISYQSGGCGGQVMCGQNLASTLGGSIMSMPTQTMQMAPMPIQMPTQVQSHPVMVPMAMPTQHMVQTEVFYETQTLPVDTQVVTQTPTAIQPQLANMPEVIFQHPVNRDLVKCAHSDVNCMAVYQAQGYMPLQNAPVIPTYNTTPSNTTYAISGTWQDNTSIPRW